MREKLTKLWRECETKQLGDIFIEYMQELGVKKIDMRKKENSNGYWVSGQSDSWNRAMCHYYKNATSFADDDIGITLRKRGGSYLIIERKGKRAFEVDCSGIRDYDKDLLSEIIKDHLPLFRKLFRKIGCKI